MAGLYIHIPFCVSKCPYCDFYSIPVSEGVLDEYTSLLLMEIGLHDRNRPIDTVYFGGGTPSLLQPFHVLKILERVQRTFHLSASPEVSLEANPESINTGRLQDYRDSGVNRLSLGVQSLQDEELRALRRNHTREVSLKALSAARQVFENLSVDIIYGIPGQTPESLHRTLLEILEFSPEHISAYELTIHKGTEFHTMQSGGELTMPDEQTVEEMFLLIHETLTGAGYEHYEISNFARPGHRCRHNMNYWLMGPYIGVGPSAHSFSDKRRWENHRDIGDWAKAIRRGLRPIATERQLSDRDLLIERLMLGLRTDIGIERDRLKCTEKVEMLIQNGHLKCEGSRLKLTPRGMLLSNRITVELLEGIWC